MTSEEFNKIIIKSLYETLEQENMKIVEIEKILDDKNLTDLTILKLDKK